MTPVSDTHDDKHSELVCLYVLRTLSPDDVPVVETQIAKCAQCRRELADLRPIVDAFAGWPADVVSPSDSLWERLAERIVPAGEVPVPHPAQSWIEPEWETVAPGISVKILASDTERDRVTMLVRLGPGVEYPPHTHAGVEELHLLDGELWINERKLYPGDYNRAEPGTSDRRVWSETGCTCVLVTSPSDVLR